MTDIHVMNLREAIYTVQGQPSQVGWKSYTIRRSIWPEVCVVMIPTVTNNPLVMINTSTLRTVDYTPSVSDILAVDWEVVK